MSIVLLMTVLASLIIWLTSSPEKTGGIIQLPSTFYNSFYGTKAAYMILDRLEYPVNRLRRPIDPATLQGTGALFVLKPLMALSEDELKLLENWIKDGHALVIVPAPYDDFNYSGRKLQDWFHLSKVGAESEEKVRTFLGANNPAAARASNADNPLTAGINELVALKSERFDASSPLKGSLEKMPFNIFWEDELGVVGLQVELGKGTIVALADAYPL